MIQITTLREKSDFVIERLAIKNFDAKAIVADILKLDENRRKIQNELDELLFQQNTLAKQVGDLYKAGKKHEGDEMKNKSGALKESSSALQMLLNDFEEKHKDKGFIRIHKSYIVQQQKIMLYAHQTVKLSDGTELPVGRIFKENIKKGMM